MKSVFFILITFLALNAKGQQIDTIFSELGTVSKNKVNLTINSVSGDQLTQVKESINYDKAVKRIEQLQRDTANLTQYLKQLNQSEEQIQVERKRVRMMRRDAVALINRLNKILTTLKP